FSRTCRSFFFFQAEDGIRDFHVTGVQTCALPISEAQGRGGRAGLPNHAAVHRGALPIESLRHRRANRSRRRCRGWGIEVSLPDEIGRASCRERVEIWGGGG